MDLMCIWRSIQSVSHNQPTCYEADRSTDAVEDKEKFMYI